MLVRVTTRLDAPAARVWDTVKRTDTLRYVTRGLLGFRLEGEEPERLAEGETYRMRLLFFGVVPAWRHEIHIVRVDDAAREIRTEERGGPVRTWRHRIMVDEEGWGSTRYFDEIEIGAGFLTPLVALYAQLFYRYRQRRWRRLARTLGGKSRASPT
jgi:ligand-binding SRPBCC domain-containing protein